MHTNISKTNNKYSYLNNTQSGIQTNVIVKHHFEELSVDGWMTLK